LTDVQRVNIEAPASRNDDLANNGGWWWATFIAGR
jgi:hypothetical protein